MCAPCSRPIHLESTQLNSTRPKLASTQLPLNSTQRTSTQLDPTQLRSSQTNSTQLKSSQTQRRRRRLQTDPRECNALAEAYTCCLSADGLSLGGKNLPTLEKMLCPPNGEADSDFMTLDPALIGAGTSERAKWGGDEGVVREIERE